MKPAPTTNRLLSALSATDLDALRPHLDAAPLDAGQVLHEPYQPLGHVWFVRRGMVSLLTPMRDGTHVETAEVGPEGMVGLELVLGGERATSLGVVRVPGEAARIEAGPFRQALGDHPGLRRLLGRYALARAGQLAQNAACARVHEVEERLASRLLLIRAAVHGAASFPLTHEAAAEMLGARRPTVSSAASKLQRAGLIACAYGTFTVLDPAGLDAASCGCHRAIRDGYDWHIGGGD